MSASTLETTVLHGSGWLEWVDASGVQGQARRPVPVAALQLRVLRGPADLRLVPQASGRVVLWRSRPAGLRRSLPGNAAAADLLPPAEALYVLQGTLADAMGVFLPRPFDLNAGNGNGHRLRLYRSSHGTAFGPEGGLRGRVRDAAGDALPWALLQLTVSPPLATPLVYAAQADAAGEFSLALQRLPMPAPGAAASFPAVLRARAVAAGSPAVDPDAQPTARIRTGSAALPRWRNQLDIAISPGRISALASPGQTSLVLQVS